MLNLITLGQPLLGEKYVAEKKEERKKNNHKNSGHFVPLQRLRAAHALRSDQCYPWTAHNVAWNGFKWLFGGVLIPTNYEVHANTC